VALVDGTSPVAQSGTVFLNTLFDENASCHIAFGDGIRTAVRGYAPDNPEPDDVLGVNASRTHIDFMVGHPDVTVSGVTTNGDRTALLVNNRWKI
jgi:aminopeptidase